MGEDHPGSAETTAVLSSGIPVAGRIDHAHGDRWFAVDMAIDTYYQLSLTPPTSDSPHLTSAILSLYDVDGRLLFGRGNNLTRPADGY